MGSRCGIAWRVAPAAPQSGAARYGGTAAADRAVEGRSAAAGRTVQRTVLGYEAGRDGLWIARYLIAHGIAVQIMHPASIPVERRGRRAKTDRIDLDMLLRTLLAWLRGEPRVCSMVCIPSEAGEDARRPERERERRVSERIALENRVENLLCLHGITGFKPRLKRAIQRLDELRRFDGTALPAMLLEELRRLMARHRVLSDQLREIEAAREQVAMAATPDRTVQQIQMLSRVRGLGLATASGVVREVFCRSTVRPQGDCRLCRPHRDTVQQQWLGTRTGHQQKWQSAGAPYPAAVGLALAALPAGQCAQSLVRRTHRRRQRAHPQDYGGGTRP